MLDLTRTRESTPEEAHGHLRFITWWITEKILLASTPPTKEEQARKMSLDPAVVQAVQYLFDPASPFETHASAVGADAGAIRTALVSYHRLPPKSQYTDERRRALRLRMYWWRRACMH